jgi:hypothetical protein
VLQLPPRLQESRAPAGVRRQRGSGPRAEPRPPPGRAPPQARIFKRAVLALLTELTSAHNSFSLLLLGHITGVPDLCKVGARRLCSRPACAAAPLARRLQQQQQQQRARPQPAGPRARPPPSSPARSTRCATPPPTSRRACAASSPALCSWRSRAWWRCCASGCCSSRRRA